MFKLSSTLYSMYDPVPPFAKNLFASLYAYWSSRQKYGGVYSHWRDFLSESQWWDNVTLQAFQVRQLKDIIAFVYENCPFYRDVMNTRRLMSRDACSLNYIKNFPIIDKTIVRENYGNIKTSLAWNKHLLFSTSGTTGASLHVPATIELLQRECAFRWQFQSVAGARRRDRFAFFTGHALVPVKRMSPPFHVRNYVENSLMFSLYHLGESTVRSYVDAFNAFEPTYVQGYPSGIFVLANLIKQNALKVFSPKAIFSGSEKLHLHQRQLIEEVFSAPVYEWYGQTEHTVNVHECQEHRLHIKEEYGLLELLKDDGTDAEPGEIGSVIGTGWGNKAFPLIRYNTGDDMVLSKDQSCRCGRGGRIIEEIMGRDEDVILTPEGRYVGRLDFVFKPVETVRESQIVQESIDSIVVKVVPLQNYSTKDDDLIIEKLRERIGKSFSIRVEKVPQIPRSANGKIRYVVSHVRAA